VLAYTDVERDLGIMIASNLKSEYQVTSAVTKANLALSTLKRTFKFWTPTLFRTLYTTFVRPHLEYAVSVIDHPPYSPELTS